MYAISYSNLQLLYTSNSSNMEIIFEKVGLSGFELRLVQYNLPPETVVLNGRMYGNEAKLLDLFCEKYKVNYSIC